MQELRHVEEHVAEHGRVDGNELQALQHELYANGKIDRKKANFLVELYKRVRSRSPAFEQFFYKALKDHLLENGRLTASKANWLRDALFSGGRIEDEARTFLHELKGEAREISPEFEKLFQEVMKQPPEQHTSK
jgi:polyhydroxyalkanoate synthesis regulator phasin